MTTVEEKQGWRIKHYEDDTLAPYYVQKMSYIDYGRFTKLEAAKEHLEFCLKDEYETSFHNE